MRGLSKKGWLLAILLFFAVSIAVGVITIASATNNKVIYVDAGELDGLHPPHPVDEDTRLVYYGLPDGGTLEVTIDITDGFAEAPSSNSPQITSSP